jgi:hypothetical protein
LWNLDLDRGPTPSGALFFPVPLDDPTGQLLTHADLRLRADVTGVVPQWGVAAKLRVDLLDNLALGSVPIGPPAVTSAQGSPAAAVVAWVWSGVETMTPSISFCLSSISRKSL